MQLLISRIFQCAVSTHPPSLTSSLTSSSSTPSKFSIVLNIINLYAGEMFSLNLKYMEIEFSCMSSVPIAKLKIRTCSALNSFTCVYFLSRPQIGQELFHLIFIHLTQSKSYFIFVYKYLFYIILLSVS